MAEWLYLISVIGNSSKITELNPTELSIHEMKIQRLLYLLGEKKQTVGIKNLIKYYEWLLEKVVKQSENRIQDPS